MRAQGLIFLFGSMILGVTGLVGCSAHAPTQREVTAHEKTEAARSACYDAVRAKETAKATTLMQVPMEERGYVVMFLNQGDQITQAVAAATGHTIDPCRATNLFDAQIAEVVAKNKTVSETGGKVLGLGKWIVGGLTVDSALDKIGGHTIQAMASEGSTVNFDSFKSGTDNMVQAGGDSTINAGQIGNTDNCAEGDCGETPEEPGDEPDDDFDLEACYANPPGGYKPDGTPLWTDECSCISHSVGRC